MRVLVHVSAFYDWKPVPEDVKVTQADVKAGRVKPAATGGFLMKVTQKTQSYTTVCISEETVIQRIIHELMPAQGCVLHSRKEAIGQILARNVMPDQAHPKFMLGFEVESDSGPDEELFHKLVSPFTTVVHEASGQVLISEEDMEAALTKYLEKATVQDHIDHLHTKFNVKKGFVVPKLAPVTVGAAS